MPLPKVPGHILVGRGFPHNRYRDRVYGYGYEPKTAGPGYGLCDCGVLSPEAVATTRERQDWHREHKQELINAKKES